MTSERRAMFERILRSLAGRLRGDLDGLEEGARAGLGGDAGGNLSNAPMHLGDLGTEAYMQELNATLLENQEYIGNEVVAALERINGGTYGQCEHCGTAIPEERLEVIPYARHCTACAEELQTGRVVNLNVGRPRDGSDTMNPHDDAERPRSGRLTAGPEPAGIGGADDEDNDDVHAVGTAGGGTAIGGLAGVNIGDGDPEGEEAELEDAMGSGNFDVALDDDHEDTTAYSSAQGGAVGGTPADKRAVGGKTGGGIAPHAGPGDSPVGQ